MNTNEQTHFYMIFGMYRFVDEVPQKSDWSTKNIGTFFVQTVLQHLSPWQGGLNEINDAFTPPNSNVSWPDIAQMYNLKDMRIVNEYGNKMSTPARYKEPEPCEIWDPSCSLYSQVSERYSSFQTCFKEVLDSQDHHFDELIFKKVDKEIKQIQPSPCLSLEMIPSCSEYCTWHKVYFETINKNEFLQAMSYASPQRKLYQDAKAIETKLAGM